MQAYAMRQRVKRAGFAELRTALLRFGERHTTEFLQLDKENRGPCREVMTQVNPTTGYQTFTGVHAGLYEQLARIERRATNLGGWAAGEMKFCRDELAKDLVGGFEKIDQL